MRIENRVFPNSDDSVLQKVLSQSLLLESEYNQNFIDIAKSSTTAKAIICLFYAIIFVLSIIGNSLVVFVILRKPEMRSVINIFITNLAISDILMTLIATPLTPAIIFVRGWSLNVSWCKLLPTVMGITVYVSTLTSTAIAIERCIVTVYHLLPKARHWISILGVLSAWIISIICSCPLAIYQDIYYDPRINITSCQENWPQKSSRAVFTAVSFVLQFIVPSLIITVCYARIGLVLQGRANKKIGTKTPLKEENALRRKRRAIKMLIAMVVIFIICWIPLNCLWLVSDLGWYDFSEWRYFTLIFFICHLFAMSSAVYNPLLYTWLNENFRNEFVQIVPTCIMRSIKIRPSSKDIYKVITSSRLQFQEDKAKKMPINLQTSTVNLQDGLKMISVIHPTPI
nr:Peptide (Tachykinin-like) G protein-coupled receptor [Hymenolepis microstoma]